MNSGKKRLGWLGTLVFATASTVAGAQQTTQPILPNAPSSLPQPTPAIKVPTTVLMPTPPAAKQPADPAPFQEATRATSAPPAAPKKEKPLDKVRHHVSLESHHRSVGIRIR